MDLSVLPVTRIPRVLTSGDADGMVGEVVASAAANVTTAGLWADEASGEPVLAYYPMDRQATTGLRAAVLAVHYGETLRGYSGLRNRSKTFGMSPRRPTHRRESCRPAGMAYDQPEVHAVIVAMADRLAADLRAFAPQIAEHDAAVMEQVAPDWRMSEGALWTSGVVNKSSTLPYHRDGFNFEAWSAMPVLRRGMTGGHLSIPEYGLTVGCRDGWVVYFAGWQLLHGVTPMRTTMRDGYRYSIVYYALRGMKSCFEYAIEVGDARKRRTDREQGMADEVEGKAPPRMPPGKGIPMGKLAGLAPGGGPASGQTGQIVV